MEKIQFQQSPFTVFCGSNIAVVEGQCYGLATTSDWCVPNRESVKLPAEKKGEHRRSLFRPYATMWEVAD